jgi:hypothetical protein
MGFSNLIYAFLS